LEAHPAIARYIGENFLSQWVQEFKRAIFMVESKDLSWEKYRLEFQGTLDQALYKVNLLEGEGDLVVHRADRP